MKNSQANYTCSLYNFCTIRKRVPLLTDCFNLHTSVQLSANRFSYPTLFPPPLSASCVIPRYLRGYFRFSTNRSFLAPFPSRCPSSVHLFFSSFFLFCFPLHVFIRRSLLIINANHLHGSSCAKLPSQAKHPRGLCHHPSRSLRRDKPPPGIRDCLDLYARIDVGRGRALDSRAHQVERGVHASTNRFSDRQ